MNEKSNEITAIPELLTMLDIENSIITLDAMGCQKEIAKQIINQQVRIQKKHVGISVL